MGNAGNTAKAVIIVLLLVGMVALFAILLQGNNVAVLNPAGLIARQQMELIIISTLIMAVIVVPVLVLTGVVAWKYRESNPGASYRPEWDGDGRLEAVWWSVPLILMAALSVIIWQSSHALDPYKPIESDKEPLTVRVVALQWKWLFLYPEQQIATVNYLHIPEDTPINLYNTSDAPMNSLWIPQLGGQIYAMNGMVTQLHLQAGETGSYRGRSANISGEGFAEMNFETKVTTTAAFQEWVKEVKQSPKRLSLARYKKLAEPGVPKQPVYYSWYKPGLHRHIVMKYMQPTSQMGNSHAHGGMY